MILEVAVEVDDVDVEISSQYFDDDDELLLMMMMEKNSYYYYCLKWHLRQELIEVEYVVVVVVKKIDISK